MHNDSVDNQSLGSNLKIWSDVQCEQSLRAFPKQLHVL